MRNRRISGDRDCSNAVCGAMLTEIMFPDTLERIGRYAFYGCENLEKISFYSHIKDIGAGAFTGCHKVRNLDVTIVEGKRSCLRELLMELREEQSVCYHSEKGEARLIFPEFFEEAVENTPARILETHTHGSGILYRNCFVQTDLQFGLYDNRFPWAKENEQLATVFRIAFGRLLNPLELSLEAEEKYRSFLQEQWKEAGVWAAEQEEPCYLHYLAEKVAATREEVEYLIVEAGKKNRIETVSYLMNYQHERYPERVKKVDKFEL